MTPWTEDHQALLSMGFSRQEYWSGLPFPSPGDLPDPGIEPVSPTLQADALLFEPPDTTERRYFHFSLSCIGEGNWQSTPVVLPGKSHEQRRLAGYSPKSCKELQSSLHMQ